MKGLKDLFVSIIYGIFFILILSVIGGFITKILWNWLIPEIFNLSHISLWQAIGINLLSFTLFKNVDIKK